MEFPKIEKKDIPDEISIRRVAHKIKIGDEIAYPDALSEDYGLTSSVVRTIDYIEDENIIVFNHTDQDSFCTGINGMVELISGSLQLDGE